LPASRNIYVCALPQRLTHGARLATLVEAVTDLPAGTLGFHASGRITSDEYRQMMEPIYAALERGEKLNIYFELAGTFAASTQALSGRT
jgi:hypothetical protein